MAKQLVFSEEARRNVLREKEALDPLAQKVEAPLSK